MDTVSTFVKQSILNYPTIFKNRLDVLSHLFSVIGNGYSFASGEPIAYQDDEVLTKCKRELKEGKTSLRYRLEQHLLDFIDANIDEISEKVNHNYPSDNCSDWYSDHYINDIHTDTALFFTADKDNLTDEWRQAFLEFGKVWSHYFFVKNMLHVYDQVKFNRDPYSPLGIYIEGEVNLSEQQLSDIENYNIINKRVHELKTPKIIEGEIARDKYASEIISKILAERV